MDYIPFIGSEVVEGDQAVRGATCCQLCGSKDAEGEDPGGRSHWEFG